MRGSEIILLDAEVVAVIDTRVSRARLGNGHEFTAFLPRKNAAALEQPCAAGARIRVAMAPFDMSCGEIVECSEE